MNVLQVEDEGLFVADYALCQQCCNFTDLIDFTNFKAS